jgi:hypothetical protein
LIAFANSACDQLFLLFPLTFRASKHPSSNSPYLKQKSVRVGSTNDPDRRRQQYEQECGGTMYYAPTDNMLDAEDKLLAAVEQAGW